MRLRGRRRPAGVERVPSEVLVPEIVVEPLGPWVLRLGPGRGLLDYPGSRPCDAVANVWPTEDGWAEAKWPVDERYGWFVAPVDLRLGHVLEFRQGQNSVAGWVAESNEAEVLVVAERSRVVAFDRAGLAVRRLERPHGLRIFRPT